ncbi:MULTISPECIES: OmpA family protein [Shewanella]|uniref:OmpA family protein n=1 Tax=Shewanella TaxID=22 RepID=UPI0021D9882A|nr:MULTISPECIES: OmpA family protein [unclassified Shewanella]MCU7986018.1 OmpA family protein [Shewanella sp. SW24]MCU8008325.1 OmpA family protein [Shewanella sp. SM87]MCU8012785.1 OmpA family protein [Shewanella sp. SM74]MCU8068190.1 OmpA family protein [Shewanella sp. SM32]MCU8075995.1 OmpA family protein [Shewanella sp. SM29]
MKSNLKSISLAVAGVLALSSCAITQSVEDNKETVIGCAIGTGLGVLIGNYLGGNEGMLYGGAAGAAIGCTVGYDFQQKREALEQLAKTENLDIQFTSISASKASDEQQSSLLISSTEQTMSKEDSEKYANYQVVGMAATVSSNSEVMFASGASEATPQAKQKFQKLAAIYKDSKQNILITGHTDASGAESLNQELSEARARYVATLFNQAGIPTERLFFQGAGESQPVAANSDDAGKAKNRRVEIIEIDGKPDQLLAYSYKQKANLSYLSRRSQDKVAAAKPTNQVEKQPTTQPTKPSTSRLEPAQIQMTESEIVKLLEPVKLQKALVDFGGKKMLDPSTNFTQLVGAKKESGFALFSKAYASEVSSLNCAVEGPRVTGDVKSLATGESYNRKDYNTADYLPGMNGTAWGYKVNGHYIGLTPVAVIKDSGTAVSAPKVNIWKNYKGSSKDDPNYQLTSHVETYYGDKGLLYRVFTTEKDSPVRCIDVVMPIDRSATAIAGKLYYEKNKTVYEADFEPKLL